MTKVIYFISAAGFALSVCIGSYILAALHFALGMFWCFELGTGDGKGLRHG
jgi:hypothetical protein